MFKVSKCSVLLHLRKKGSPRLQHSLGLAVKKSSSLEGDLEVLGVYGG
jgi:hypothetical protein